jgi:hypothetical protein
MLNYVPSLLQVIVVELIGAPGRPRAYLEFS